MTTVFDAVNAVTSDARERLAMLIGALLEGGSLGEGPFGVGDAGTSFGPWQFHYPGGEGLKLGLTPEQARDPAQAARAILPAYSAAVKRIPDALWDMNPSLAAATAAYYAEQPAYMYPAERIAGAWQSLANLAAGGGVGADSGDGGATLVDWKDWLDKLDPRNLPGGIGDGIGAIPDALKWVSQPFVSIGQNIDKLANPSTWWRLLFVIAGAGLILVGIGILNKNAVIEAAGTFTGAAAKAA